MTTLSRNTKVQLGLAVTVFSGVVVVLWQGSSMISAQQATNKTYADELRDLKEKTWTIASASEHALRTAMENPGLRVPDPRDPSKVFVVHNGATQPQKSSTP